MTTIERESQSLFHTYKRLPLEIERGEGVYLYAKDGTRYLDMFGGLAVNSLGYGNPKVLKVIQEQSAKYIHLSNYFLQEPQVQLAELLLKYSGFSKVFFGNSGTEVTEGAMKLVRKWGSTRNKKQIISFTKAFHGRTYGALSLMDNQKYKSGFEPFLDNCTIIEFNNPQHLREQVNEQTTAIILEFIQGEGGVRPVSQEFVAEIKSLKEQYGFLLVADEIQAGLGRTGKMFAFQHYNIQPDVIIVAKPLGGGLPLGAIIGSEAVADVLSPGLHGTTFGGNPVACAAGVVSIQEIMENGLVQNAQNMGNLLKTGLESIQSELPTLVKEVRGIGLMVGMDLTRDGEQIVTSMRERGILINCTDTTVLRFLPPLIVEEEHIQTTLANLKEVFSAI